MKQLKSLTCTTSGGVEREVYFIEIDVRNIDSMLPNNMISHQMIRIPVVRVVVRFPFECDPMKRGPREDEHLVNDGSETMGRPETGRWSNDP
jgi:hypothetical protein